MNRDRSYYRKMRKRAIKRKKNIITFYNCWQTKFDGELSKGKVHCSCGACTSKTRNKGNRRKIHGNYSPNINFKHSDLLKIESMDSQLNELLLIS